MGCIAHRNCNLTLQTPRQGIAQVAKLYSLCLKSFGGGASLERQPNRFLSKISGWPIVGRLSEVPHDSLVEAKDEIVSALIFSTMPFWFLPIVGGIIFLEPPQFLSALAGGELFIYSATLVGPLAYVIHKRYGRFKAPKEDPDEPDTPLTFPFPYGKTFSYLVIIICILSGFIFSIQRVRSIPALRNIHIINEDGLLWLSIFVFFVAHLVLFCVTAYRNMLEGLAGKHSERISRALQVQETEAYDEWIGRKES